MIRNLKRLCRFAVAAVAVPALSCVHAVTVRPAPSYDAYSFEAILPLRAAVHADGERLAQELRIGEYDDGGFCEGNRYPVDARDAFRESVTATLERLVEQVEATPEPLDRQGMEAQGFDAVFLVRADGFGLGLDAGVLGDVEAVAELSLVVSAYTNDGLQLRETVYGSAVQTGDVTGCGGGADVLAAAVESAIESAMTDLGELVANAPALRSGL